MMKKEFGPYELAVKLKALGFDEPCFAYWGLDSDSNVVLETRSVSQNGDLAKKECLAPTFSQAFRWFREKKISDSCICRYQSRDDGGIYYYYVINHDFGIEETKHFKEGFYTYEEAELACLNKLIEIVESNKE